MCTVYAKPFISSGFKWLVYTCMMARGGLCIHVGLESCLVRMVSTLCYVGGDARIILTKSGLDKGTLAQIW